MNSANLGLGTFLQFLRRTEGLSLRDVEEETGISNSYISQLENGRECEVSPRKLRLLAEAYGVPYVALLHMAGYLRPGDISEAVEHMKDSMNA